MPLLCIIYALCADLRRGHKVYWAYAIIGGRFAKIVQGERNRAFSDCRAAAYLIKNAPTVETLTLRFSCRRG